MKFLHLIPLYVLFAVLLVVKAEEEKQEAPAEQTNTEEADYWGWGGPWYGGCYGYGGPWYGGYYGYGPWYGYGRYGRRWGRYGRGWGRHGRCVMVSIPTSIPTPSQPELVGVQALEEHFYIRFPTDLAESIREDLRDVRKPSDLSLTFITPRRATVQFGASERLSAILVDIPTVTETIKSLEAGHGPSTTGQYCKVAEAAQMLIVFSTDEQADEFEERMRAVDFQYQDGLTPPMHQARQRRFNPTRAGVRVELEQIEEQVRALLERDSRSTLSRFEYYQNDRLVKSSEPTIVTREEIEDSDDDLAAEIEDELMHGSDTEPSVSVPNPRQERLDELEAKRTQLARVTNPAIRAFLEETIKQLESELQ